MRARWILKPLLAGLGGLTVAAILKCPPPMQAGQPGAPRAIKVDAPEQGTLPSPTSPPVAEQLLTLTEARQMASVQQPAVAAAHSSLAAAQARYNAVAHLRALAIIERDYQIRKDQACIGVEVAEAGLAQAEADAIYVATRLYLGVLYARTQLQVADDVSDRLKKMQNAADIKVKTFGDVHRLKIEGYQDIVVERREEAIQGEKRALAALREALGAVNDCSLQVAPGALPDLLPPPCCGDLVEMALSRRGDLAQANLALALSDKEVCAQRKHMGPQARTFAAGGDIHSRQVPEANYGADYSPGAIPPEMPTYMFGWRKGRVDQACALAARATAVADKAHNLVVLETEDHYLKMEENLKKMMSLRTAYANRKKTLDEQLKLLDEDKKLDPDMILTAGEFTTRLRLDLNTAQYQYLLELAALERVTAGGYCPGFDAVPPGK